jgi:hypothetical protein
MGIIRDRIGRIPDEAMRPALLAHAEAMEAGTLSAVGRLGLRHSVDYVVMAETPRLQAASAAAGQAWPAQCTVEGGTTRWQKQPKP